MNCIATSAVVACSVEWGSLIWAGFAGISLLAVAVLILAARRA